MAKALLGLHSSERPDTLIFIMDAKGETFREKIYPEYKGTRDRMPDDLKSQEKHITRLLAAMEIPVLEKLGYEADDIIGTLATRLRTDPQNEISILSGDKDLYQFIGGNVVVYDTMKRSVMRSEQAWEKFGVGPEHVVDYLSITGDSSDNIPGIKGFGPKKAQSLIGEFGSLESIYENLDKMPEKTRLVLEENREVAFLSKKLASIDTTVEIECDLDAHVFRDRSIVNPAVRELFREFEFRSLLPDDEQVLANFDSLGVTYTKIDSGTELEKLLPLVLEAGRVALATKKDASVLTGIALDIPDTGKYFIDVSVVSVTEFIQSLLNADIEIIGFELKEDIKTLWQYLDNVEAPASGQLGIF